jgi:predicted nucleotidyltransferase
MLSKDEILNKLKKFRPIFEKDGVIILGLFGSYAISKATKESDIDILIDTTPSFLEKYKGFSGFSKLEEIKNILKQEFNLEVDLVDKQGLLQHNNEYILKKAIYV